MSLSKEKKRSIIQQFRRKDKDAGSCEVQVALLTARINEQTEHAKVHKKDNHSRRGLIRLVERRKRLLQYLEREDSERYQKLIQALNLRK